MVFNSIFFIFCFLPVFMLIYYLVPGKLRNLLLFLGSLIFYAWGEPVYVILMLFSSIFNYYMGTELERLYYDDRKQKINLIFSIIINLAVLVFFKYYGFLLNTIGGIIGIHIPHPELSLPIGLSFYTFRNLSYLFDIYLSKVSAQRNFLAFAVYSTMFPYTSAGPIVRYTDIETQLKQRTINISKFGIGAELFVKGLAKKVLLADNLSVLYSSICGHPQMSVFTSWLGILAYTMQLYFDFSGYSDMAIGLGRMFNIDIPYNFLSPYKSDSFSELWRRWHITLGRALSTYIYIPLGGSRRGRARTFFNTFLTFFVSGLWHGAAWTFVLWGCIHGLFVALEKLFPKLLSAIPRWLRIACTFVLVNALWVLFRAESFQQAAMVYSGMLSFTSLDLSQIAALVLDNSFDFPTAVDIAYLFSLLAVLLFVVFRCKNSRQRLETFSCNGKTLAFTVFLFCFSVLHLSRESIFIYFNF